VVWAAGVGRSGARVVGVGATAGSAPRGADEEGARGVGRAPGARRSRGTSSRPRGPARSGEPRGRAGPAAPSRRAGGGPLIRPSAAPVRLQPLPHTGLPLPLPLPLPAERGGAGGPRAVVCLGLRARG